MSALFAFLFSLSWAAPNFTAPSPEEPTRSRPASQPPIDLKTAVQKALDKNNALLQIKEKIEQAKYDKSTVKSILYPTINATLSAGQFKSAENANGQTAFGGSTYNQYLGDIKLTQPLLAFGSLSAIQVADDTIHLSEIDYEVSSRTLTANVIQTFYKVLLSQHLLKNLEKVQKVVTESLATAQKRLRTGRGQLLDVLQVKTQMALLKPQIEDARNQMESAGAQLATLLAEDGKYYLDLKGKLSTLLLKDIQAAMTHNKARWPELEKIVLQMNQLGDQKWVTNGKHLPSLAFIGDYGSQSFNKAQVFENNATAWSLQLQLTIPIFTGLSSYSERGSYASQERALEFAKHDLENNLSLAQVQSLKALQSTETSLLSAEEAADLAHQSMTEATRNYGLATIDFLQFLSVEQSTVQADSSLDNIKYNNIVAMTNYFVASGHPLNTLIDLLGAQPR